MQDMCPTIFRENLLTPRQTHRALFNPIYSCYVTTEDSRPHLSGEYFFSTSVSKFKVKPTPILF